MTEHLNRGVLAVQAQAIEYANDTIRAVLRNRLGRSELEWRLRSYYGREATHEEVDRFDELQEQDLMIVSRQQRFRVCGVYVLWNPFADGFNGGSGIWKIGKSTNVARRLTTHGRSLCRRTGSRRWYLTGVLECDEANLSFVEKALHLVYKRYRVLDYVSVELFGDKGQALSPDPLLLRCSADIEWALARRFEAAL